MPDPTPSPHQIFISYATPDRAVAEEICAGLEAKGIKCWIAPRDASGEYAGQITNAIRSASVFLLVLSSAANASGHVRSEVAIAGDRHTPMLPVRTEDVLPHETLEFYVRKWQWFDSFGDARIHADDLVLEVRRLMPAPNESTRPRPALSARNWAWWSKDWWDDDARVSILSLAETGLATAVYLFVASRGHTTHLLFAACIAPLLLLRTPMSTRLGKKWVAISLNIDKSFLSIDSSTALDRRRSTVRGILDFLMWTWLYINAAGASLSVAFTARFGATLLSTLRHPFAALSAVPLNWWRLVAQTDTGMRPTPVPGYTEDERVRAMAQDHMMIVDPILGFWKQLPGLRILMPLPLALLANSVLFLPFIATATAYRWAIKGSALFWSPLVWIAHSSFRPHILRRVLDVRRLAIFSVGRAWAVVVLALGGLKVLFLYLAVRPSDHCPTSIQAAACSNVIVPNALPPWQLAMLTNAILAWVLYLIADWALHRMRNGRLPAERFLDGFFKTMWLVRGTLSLYTIACSIYLAAFLSGRWPWLPALGTKVFPWVRW